VDWCWQAADTALGKARGGGDEVGPNPTDRANRSPYQRRPEQLAHDVSADLPERVPQVAEEPGILVGIEQVRIAIAAWDDGQNAVRPEDLG
jgi:hypothetical protein